MTTDTASSPCMTEQFYNACAAEARRQFGPENINSFRAYDRKTEVGSFYINLNPTNNANSPDDDVLVCIASNDQMPAVALYCSDTFGGPEFNYVARMTEAFQAQQNLSIQIITDGFNAQNPPKRNTDYLECKIDGITGSKLGKQAQFFIEAVRYATTAGTINKAYETLDV